MDAAYEYEIWVEGHLTDRWSDWFDGLAVHNHPGGKTIISGPLIDQTALFGVLAKIHALNLTLVSVKRLVPTTLEHSLSADKISRGRR